MNLEPVVGEGTVRLPIAALKPCAFRLRLEPPNEAHVELLVQSGGSWPPLLVCAEDHSIVDGTHRFLAARRLGISHLECHLFSGEGDAAFVEALRLNSTHGLALTLRERETAAKQVIEMHGQWSDRRIAALCGLSPTTVGRLRLTRPPRPSADSGRMDARIGRDDRVRPLDNEAMRRRVTAEIEARPAASLREIASAVHCSPETVRSVRKSIGQPAVRRLRVAAPEVSTETEVADPVPLQAERVDLALVSTAEGLEFKEWFDTTFVDRESCAHHVMNVPLSRVYEIADQALHRSLAWRDFARALEARVKAKA